MFGELQENEIEIVLKRELIGRIGCYANDSVYVVPISYAYDGTYFYAHTKEGKKIDMMRSNPMVCFEVDSVKNMATWQSVICWGEFEELPDGAQRKEALKKLHERVLPFVSSATTKLNPEWPFTPDDLNTIKGIVFRIRILRKTGKYENNTVPSFLAWG